MAPDPVFVDLYHIVIVVVSPLSRCFVIYIFFLFNFYFPFAILIETKTKKMHKITVPILIPNTQKPKRKEWIEKKKQYLAAVEDNMLNTECVDWTDIRNYVLLLLYGGTGLEILFRVSVQFSFCVHLFLHAKYFASFRIRSISLSSKKFIFFVNIADIAFLNEHWALWALGTIKIQQILLYQEIYENEIYGTKFMRQNSVVGIPWPKHVSKIALCYCFCCFVNSRNENRTGKLSK